MTKFKPIIDTHVHSHFSILDGVSSPADNVKRAVEMGSPAIALTDHGTVAGLYEFYFAAKKSGILPLLGCELYMKEVVGPDNTEKYFHGLFIATSNVGYKNLIRLSSLGHRPDHMTRTSAKSKSYRPAVSFQEIFDNSEGLLFSTGCMIGILGTARGVDESGVEKSLSYEEVDSLISRFKDVFKDKMFVELGPAKVCTDFDRTKRAHVTKEVREHKFGPMSCTTNCLQRLHNMRGLHMAMKHNIPVLIATDAHMKDKELKPVQDLLIKSSLGNSTGWHFDQIHALMPSEELWQEFQKYHEYVPQSIFIEGIENGYKVAEMCKGVDLKFKPLIPKFPLHIHPLYKDGMTSKDLMFAVISNVGRLKNETKYLKRLNEEIKVICDNGVTDYTDYFLILADVARHAREIGVGMGPARGSAGGCLLSYLMGITALDPVQLGLSFERFLNVGRLKSGHPPDIDMDFTERDPIVEYIFNTYGEDHTALVGAFQTMKTKAAIRDIVRHTINGGILTNVDPVHKICQTIETAPQYFPSEEKFLKGFEDDDEVWHPGHLETNKVLSEYLDANPTIKTYLFKILEKPRHSATHAGGVVITPENIDEVIPTRYYDGKKCTQIDYRTLEKIGGMKIDILGVTTLHFIWNTIKKVQKNKGITLDPWNLPEDPASFEMLHRGETATVFQFDTDVVRPFLVKIKPKSVWDLVLITSVARPGGLDSTLEDGKPVAVHFMRRFLKSESISYIDPILEPILNKTFGLVIFQEQIQKIFEVVGGLTPVESDDARRAVGKKNLQVLLSIKGQLFDNAIKKLSWPLEKCEELWESFIGAANYAFNLSHAYAYGIIAYACAYLKHNHPLEWWSSVLSHSDNDKIKSYISIIGDKIGYPSVNAPYEEWVIRDEKLFAPLNMVMGVGKVAMAEIFDQVHTVGPFTSFKNFHDRIKKQKVNKSVILHLIVAGCFNGIPLEDDGTPIQDSDISKVVEYLMKLRGNKKNDLPEEFNTTKLDNMVDRVLLQSKLLPIVSCNFVDRFVKNLSYYSGIKNGRRSGKDYPSIKFSGTEYAVVGDYDNLSEAYRDLVPPSNDRNPMTDEVALYGVVSELKPWDYKDKKTGETKHAGRLFFENDHKITRITVWPDKWQQIKETCRPGKLAILFGRLKINTFYGNGQVEFTLDGFTFP